MGTCCVCSTQLGESLVVIDFPCVHVPCLGKLQAIENKCNTCGRLQHEDEVGLMTIKDRLKATGLGVLSQLILVAELYTGKTF